MMVMAGSLFADAERDLWSSWVVAALLHLVILGCRSIVAASTSSQSCQRFPLYMTGKSEEPKLKIADIEESKAFASREGMRGGQAISLVLGTSRPGGRSLFLSLVCLVP